MSEEAAVVDSEDVKILRSEFFHKGKPLLAKESTLKLVSVAYSLLIHSPLPADEQEMQRVTEMSTRNQAFQNLVKVIYIFCSFPTLVN